MAKNFNQIVLISGASSGIGAEIARAFAKQGASLSLTGRNEEKLSKVSRECKDLGAGNIIEIIADLSEKEGIAKVVKETMDIYDKLDVLVNSAGFICSGSTEKATFDTFNKLGNINLRAPFFLTQLCIPFLEKAKGNVVNVSSCSSRRYKTDYCAFAITKAGLDHFTKTAALELSAKGIRVNAINPGVVRTNVRKGVHRDGSLKKYYARVAPLHPLGKRIVELNEVTDAVLFLSSDAAKMITGVCLSVDGGRALTGL